MTVKQNVPVSFAQGLDTKTDPLQVQLGSLLELENGQFTKTGSLTKRNGYDVLGNQTEGGGVISNGTALATYNDQLLMFDGYQMYSYVESGNIWTVVDQCVSLSVNSTQIIRTNEASQLNPCSNTINGVQCVAWEDSRGGVWYSVIDSATSTNLVHEVRIDAAAYAPKIIVFNGQFVILYMLGNILNYRLVSPYNPSVIAPAVQLHTDGYSTSVLGSYDATVIGSKIFVGYLNSASKMKLYSVNQSWAISARQNASGTLTLQNSNWCCNVMGDSLQNVYLNYSDGYSVTVNIGAYTVDVTGGFFLFGGTVVESVGAQINAITAVSLTPYTGTAGEYVVFYEVNAASSINHRVHIADVNFATGTTITKQRGAGLASKAFLHNNVPYANLLFQSTLQATYFTISAARKVVAKINNELGGVYSNNTLLPEVPSTGSQFTFANLLKGKILSQNNTLFTPLGVNVSTINFLNSNQFLSATLSNNLFISGAVLQCYDGANLTEAGFHLYPEGATGTPFASGGSLGSGLYQYTMVYACTDNFGQINYSATHTPISVTTSSGSSRVSITGPMLRLTNKVGVTIIIYRTLLNQGNFYRVTSAVSPIMNDPTVDTFTYVDTLSDATISSTELVYTTGGALDNIAPPACSIICTYNNRVFISGMEDPNLIWYSKNKFDNTNENTIPVEFSDFNTIGVNAFGGRVTALAQMDSNLIIFKENNIYSIAGNGPDDTGNNSDYPISGPALITTDAGCVNASSVVLMPLGLMFQSSKGIYLLDRSQQPEYIGAPVEAYNGFSITSASLSQSTNQVIFTTSAGPTLVYDYFHKQWAVWTNSLTSSQGGVIWDGQFTFVKANGLVFTQDTSTFTDGGTAISLKWTSANISLAQIQGYQMVYSIYLLGQFKSAHQLQVQIAYDFNPTYTETCLVTPQNASNFWGSAPVWGADAVWGGPYQVYEFRINPSRKKCSSFRISVKDINSTGEGYSISNMMLVVGVLPGGNRLPQSNQSAAT